MPMRLDVPANFRSWSLGARALPGGFRGVSGPLWEHANHELFEATQRAVHVISGDLKESGREEVHLEGSRVVASVEYGDETVDYAQYELDRGGVHDYMGIGWEETQPLFAEVFGKTWLRVVETWDVRSYR